MCIHFYTGLEILCFPCNQFGEKECLNDLMLFIHDQCHFKFFLFNTVDVNGPNCSDLYKYLKKRQPGFMNGFITSNFTIFIISRKGHTVNRINPKSSIDFLQTQIEKFLSSEI